MSNNASVLSYVERSARRAPQSTAVVDESASLTYAELEEQARRIGSTLIDAGSSRRAVVVCMEKSCLTVAVMMGVLYAGGHYVPVDPSIPAERMGSILSVLEGPLVVIEDEDSLPSSLEGYGHVVCAADLVAQEVDHEALETVRSSMLETDPAYVLFTSGSTGVPKGVAISHHAIRCFIDAFVEVVGIRASDRIGNQAPFDFDVSTKDIYGAFSTGATLVIIPRAYFMQPIPLMEYLAKQRVTVLIWAVAALCIVTAYHAFKQVSLPDLRVVAFSGEVMPLKHLREWRASVPGATFFNLYGPTEITCNCLYLKLDDDAAYPDGLPLGHAFPHCEVFLVDNEGNEVTEPGVQGELLVRGPSLALGYVGLEEQTARAFTQNPLHNRFPDRVYHTGDLASFTEEGELFFRGRKDNQIKHQGHRIELEDIDHTIEQLQGVSRCRCAYDHKRKRLRAFYEGQATEAELKEFIAVSLPAHMRPSALYKVDSMPLNSHGKVDRAKLLEGAKRVRPRKGEVS